MAPSSPVYLLKPLLLWPPLKTTSAGPRPDRLGWRLGDSAQALLARPTLS